MSVQGSDYALLKKEAGAKNYTVYDCGASFGTDFIAFNLSSIYTEKTKYNWFSDIKFRKAVAHALDKETMINNVMNGLGVSQDCAMSEAAGFFYNPNVRKYGYNPEISKTLLKEAGFVDSNKDGILEKPAGIPAAFSMLTNAENNVRVDLGTIIQADLKAIGLDVSFRPIDFNNLVTKLNYTHDWDAVLIGLTGGVEPHSGKNVWATDGHLHLWNIKPEPQRTQSVQRDTDKNKTQINTDKDEPHLPAGQAGRTQSTQITEAGSQKAEDRPQIDTDLIRWEESLPSWEKEIDMLFNKGVQELDPEKRKQIYWKWQEIAADNLPLIHTVSPKAIYAVRNNIKGIKPTALGGVFHNIEEIWIKENLRND